MKVTVVTTILLSLWFRVVDVQAQRGNGLPKNDIDRQRFAANLKGSEVTLDGSPVTGTRTINTFPRAVPPLPSAPYTFPPIFGDSGPGGAPPPGSDPSVIFAWWASLTSDQQANWPYEWSNYFGSTDGIPASARDKANRGNLLYSFSTLSDQYIDPANEGNSQLLAELKAKLTGMSDIWTRIHDGLEVTGNYVFDGDVGHEAGSPIPGTAYLMLFSADGQGRWAISIGDPDTAHNLELTVPGVGRGLNDWLFQDLSNLDTTMSELWREGGPMDQTAGIIWVGYDAPSTIFDIHQIPPWPTIDEAVAAAPALVQFQQGLLATHQSGGSAPHITVIGHSYGTDVVAEATLNGRKLLADDIILIGSPGVPVANAQALAQNSITSIAMSGQTQVWASLTGLDIVNIFVVLGTDVWSIDFGATKFQSDLLGDHGGYWQGQGLTNMAAIILGNYNAVTPWFPLPTPS